VAEGDDVLPERCLGIIDTFSQVQDEITLVHLDRDVEELADERVPGSTVCL
jgi:hypothetical protein